MKKLNKKVSEKFCKVITLKNITSANNITVGSKAEIPPCFKYIRSVIGKS